MELLQKKLEERPTAERALRSLGEAVGLSRSTIFRRLHAPSSATNHDVELRGQIQSIALEMRSYGYRPLTEELHRRGLKVNHKRVCAYCAKTICSVCDGTPSCALPTRITR